MKNFYLFICFSLIFFSGNLPAFSQDANVRKFNSDQPVFFSPKNHDPNFLKSGKLSERSFYQRKGEWQHIIDSTWGPGAPMEEKLLIFNTYAQAIRDSSDILFSLKLDWDSLYNHYLNQINESTSKGAFSAIMSHFSYDLNDAHTVAYDKDVIGTALNPGVPILFIGNFVSVEHFGAYTTVLPDSTILVLRAVPNHPLNLEPGDIILGYEGVPWKNLVRELMDAGLPMNAMRSGCKTANDHQRLIGAGMNWHLFSTIDVLKYSTSEIVHLSLQPMINFQIPPMANNEQLPVPGVPFPKTLPYPLVSDTVVTYGIIENTNIGYIYLVKEGPSGVVEVQFYNAVNALKYTDALIIDMRLNFGGWAHFQGAFNTLFHENYKAVEHAFRCDRSTVELCLSGDWTDYQIKGHPLTPYYYNRPIAVLLGPSCVSMGDVTAHRLRYLPMAKFFGANPMATHGWYWTIDSISGWNLSFSNGDMFHTSTPGVYLNGKEFPINYPIWFNKDDVAKGKDPVVEKSLEWIRNLAYGATISVEKGRYSAGNDTVKIHASVENPSAFPVSVRLIFENLEGLVVDSVEMTQVNTMDKNDWLGLWIKKGLPENMYRTSIKVTNQNNGTSITNKHVTRITNVPLMIDKFPCTYVFGSEYTYQPYLKNAGKAMVIKNMTIKLKSTDPWVKSITPFQTVCKELKPGNITRTPSFDITRDEATFPGYYNLTFEMGIDGWTYWTKDTTIYIPTGIRPEQSHPLANFLDQNYPNPFITNTTIGWQLAKESRVTLKVFDLVGREVAIPVDEQRPVGKYETEFKAATLPKGVYFYQLKAGDFMQTRKMMLMK